MFEYYKGYEIDGSDTSYSLLTPNFEKMKEILKYFLNLKIIDKKKEVYVHGYSIKRNKYKCELEKSYNIANIEKLFEDLIKFDIDSITLKYQYVNIENIYPDVKNEIIEYILKKSDKYSKFNLINPILSSVNSYYDVHLTSDIVDVIKIVEGREIDYSFDLTPKNMKDSYLKLNYYDMDFGVSFIHGMVPLLLSYYTLEKIAEGFPEYNIMPFNDFNEIAFDFEHAIDYDISECFEIHQDDLKTIISNEVFQFTEKNKASVVDKGWLYTEFIFEKLDIFNKVIEDYSCNDSTKSYDLGKNIFTSEYKVFSLSNKYKTTEKNYLAYEDYIQLCTEIYNLNYLSINEIRKFTTTYLNIYENVNSNKYYKCKLRFNVEREKTFFQLIVPVESRKAISRFIER